MDWSYHRSRLRHYHEQGFRWVATLRRSPDHSGPDLPPWLEIMEFGEGDSSRTVPVYWLLADRPLPRLIEEE